MAVDYGVVVVGGGVVGLSIARSLASRKEVLNRGILLLERHQWMGHETSSRSSEVIHGSIYYKKGSLKAKLCSQGNQMMYELCKQNSIPFTQNGKLIVAWENQQLPILSQLLHTAVGSGARAVRIIDDPKEIHDLEPNVNAVAALHSPTSGVVDSASLLEFLQASVQDAGVDVVNNTEVNSVQQMPDSTLVATTQTVNLNEFPVKRSGDDSDILQIRAQIVINCAGIGAGRIASSAGIDLDKARYRIHANRSTWFKWSTSKSKLPSMLIYPLPLPGSLGIHTTPHAVSGEMRLGPYAEWLPTPTDYQNDYNQSLDAFIGSAAFDLSVEEEKRDIFFKHCSPFLPTLKIEDLQPESTAIHPKLQAPGEKEKRDWIIEFADSFRIPNLLNVLGIDSPGLTGSPAIGVHV
mmetsp:Transcript_4212/g.7395  ORF Transcript_4212/g.7395 Transcript_4212/m.7395 type:complete len:407 (-) Transcript_4212:33-1253(-)